MNIFSLWLHCSFMWIGYRVPMTPLPSAILCLAAIAAVARADEPRELQLDLERSVIEVEVKATFDSFAGRLDHFKSEILVDAAADRVEHAQVEFAFADLKTGRARRDRDMLEWEEAVDHPRVRFRLDRLERTRGAPVTAHGWLALHGVEHAVSFPVSFLVDGAIYAIDGEVALDYRDYGLPVIRKFLLVTVDPHLRVRFHLQGTLASGGNGRAAAADTQ